MLTYNNQFEIELKKLIAEEIERLTENLSNGLSVTDFSEYKLYVGKISALRSVVEMCDDVQTTLSKR